MAFSVPIGKKAPDEFNVIIEIPSYSDPVKYEFDEEMNILTVDRFMLTTMQYPCNYGFIPNTLSKDGDPVDVLIISPYALRPGVVINCRPIGMLNMVDEAGIDIKIIAVPTTKVTTLYESIKEVEDLPKALLNQIEHFFKHYKDLESNKWVKISGFSNSKLARTAIKECIKNKL